MSKGEWPMPAGNEGILDKVKEVAERFTDKVRGLFGQHSDKADATIDKAGDFVDDKTGDKYSEHVDKAQDAMPWTSSRAKVTRAAAQRAVAPPRSACRCCATASRRA